MNIQRIVASALAVVMTLGAAPLLAQQPQPAATTGSFAGTAGDKAKAPYSNWAVQLRDATTGMVASTSPINPQGTFRIASVPLSRPFLLELVQVQEKKIVCTKGPFTLTVAAPSLGGVTMDCNKNDTARWLLVAGAGAAAAIAITTRSSSR